jgi:hypothetical protein
MFQGMMIDELIQSVERAEQNARKQQEQTAPPAFNLNDYPVRRIEWRQITEVA